MARMLATPFVMHQRTNFVALTTICFERCWLHRSWLTMAFTALKAYDKILCLGKLFFLLLSRSCCRRLLNDTMFGSTINACGRWRSEHG
jgi:hypothetical protein